jgi:hypothetical protein
MAPDYKTRPRSKAIPSENAFTADEDMKTKRRIEITRYSRRVTVIHGTGAARSVEAGDWAADLVIQEEFPIAGLVSNEGPPIETTEDQPSRRRLLSRLGKRMWLIKRT